MRGVASLRDRAILVWSAERIHGIWAVIFLVGLAVVAGQVCLNLRTDTGTVTDFDGLHILSDLDDLSHDLMADADWKRAFTPASVDGVNVGTADAAAVNGDVDVTVFEWLELELPLLSVTSNGFSCRRTNLLLLEVLPFRLILDHETGGILWIRHLCWSWKVWF